MDGFWSGGKSPYWAGRDLSNKYLNNQGNGCMTTSEIWFHGPIKLMLIQDNPFGFSKANLGGHSARSMMFLEMCALFRALPLAVAKGDFARAIVGENVLEKPTLSSRKKSLRHLLELYGLDPSRALFRVLDRKR